MKMRRDHTESEITAQLTSTKSLAIKEKNNVTIQWTVSEDYTSNSCVCFQNPITGVSSIQNYILPISAIVTFL